MKRLILLVAMCLLVGSVGATYTNFTNFTAYGDAWKANNDTKIILMWNGTGNHQWLSTGNATSIQYLIVAGGGGAVYAGGGAGGVLNATSYPVVGLINITVGAGGAGGAATSYPGGNSSLGNLTANLTAIGGGFGPSTSGSGGNGGSGGGVYKSAGSGGIGTSGQGFDGGACTVGNGASGGGGNGAAAAACSGAGGSSGGDGLSYQLLNDAYAGVVSGGIRYIAGGGSGTPNWLGGKGGGGNGNIPASGGNAIVNTGGGGGGNWTGGGGGSGGSGIIILEFNGPEQPISASFTQSPNPSSTGQAVTFTDTSTGTPVTWNWTINGALTNTTQNIAYTFTTVGTYYVDLNVTNSSGSFSNITQTHTVVNASGFTPKDIWMEQQLLQTWHITDSSTGLPIPIVQLQDSAMQTFTTTNGTGYLTEEFGPSTVVFMAEGYTSKAVSYFFDSDATHTVQLVTANPSPVPNTNTIFSPRLVRLRAVDQWRTPLTPVTITASYIADTLPNNDPVYLQNAFGVSASVASLMMNSSIAMSGVTGSDGSNTFSMFPALTYNLTVTNETMGVHCQQNLAPADTDYVLYCPTDAQKAAVVPLSQTLNRSYIWVTEPNASYVTINASYQDPDGLTSSVLFNVTVVDNNTVIYSKDFGNPGTSQVLDNYTMPNIRGMQIKSYLAYNRSA